MTTYDESLIVLLELLDTASLAGIVAHRDAQCPFINRLSARKGGVRGDILVFLEQSGSDEWLGD